MQPLARSSSVFKHGSRAQAASERGGLGYKGGQGGEEEIQSIKILSVYAPAPQHDVFIANIE